MVGRARLAVGSSSSSSSSLFTSSSSPTSNHNCIAELAAAAAAAAAAPIALFAAAAAAAAAATFAEVSDVAAAAAALSAEVSAATAFAQAIITALLPEGLGLLLAGIEVACGTVLKGIALGNNSSSVAPPAVSHRPSTYQDEKARIDRSFCWLEVCDERGPTKTRVISLNA